MKRQTTTHQIHLPASTVAKVVLLVALAVFLWLIRDILILFFVALLLAALIDPAAHWFEKKHIPRGAAVLLIYLFLAAAAFSVFVLFVPSLFFELAAVAEEFALNTARAKDGVAAIQDFINRIGLPADVSSFASVIQEQVSSLLANFVKTVTSVLSSALSAIIVLVLAYYMVVEEKEGKKFLRHITPRRYHAYILGLSGRMQERLGYWLRGQLILMLVVGAVSYIGLTALGVPFALALAVLAGLLEFVPYAGPILAAVPAVLVAFSVSPEKALFALILCFVIQQIENAVLVPKIMQRETGLNPVVSLFALMVGYTLGGIGGAILAIPFTAALLVFLNDIWGDQ
ncbi:MAG: AI-2E family transporter [Patescibacteria group bacterium]